jgi:hypothetical protein
VPRDSREQIVKKIPDSAAVALGVGVNEMIQKRSAITEKL